MCDLNLGVYGAKESEKTLLSLKFLSGASGSSYYPVRNDSFTKNVNIDGKSVNLVIDDTTGQDDFSEMRFNYYSKIQAAILVFDISRPSSIDTIKKIYHEIKDDAENIDAVIAVAANRGYLREKNAPNLVSIDTYNNLEKYFKCKVFETNTETGKNVQELFDYIIRQYLSILNKEKFSGDTKNRNSKVLDSSKSVIKSSDLVRKRSTSIMPKSCSNFNESSGGNSEVFSSPMGAEIKTILQSRTKQLQQALEDKKQLEKQLQEANEQLQKANEKIKQLENKEGDDELLQDKKEKKRSRSRSKTTNVNTSVHFIISKNGNDNSQNMSSIKSYTSSEIDDLKKETPYEVLKVNDGDKFMTMFIYHEPNMSHELFQKYEALNQLNHPNIAKIYGLFIDEQTHVQSTVLIEYYLNNLTNVMKKLTSEEKVSIIYQIADALKKSHSIGISHLNLTPDNIYIDSENRPKVTNFGTSLLIQFDSSKTIRKKFPLTYQYMAPELQRCKERQDEQVDVYSFGIIIHYIISNGEFPKTLKTEKTHKIDFSELPECFKNHSQELLKSCCSEDPSDRPSFENIVTSLDFNLEIIDGVDASIVRSKIQNK